MSTQSQFFIKLVVSAFLLLALAKIAGLHASQSIAQTNVELTHSSTSTLTTYMLRDILTYQFSNFRGAVSDPDRKRMYATYWYQNIVVIDAHQATIEATITNIHRPDRLLLSSDGLRLYVSNNTRGSFEDGGITVVDTESLTIVTSFTYSDNIKNMVLGPTHKLHIVPVFGASIQTMDLTSGEIVATVPATGSLIGLASYNDKLYVTNLKNPGGQMEFSLLQYNISTGIPILEADVPVIDIGSLAVTTDGSSLLVHSSAGIVYQYDTDSFELIRTYGEDIDEGFISIAISSNSLQFVGKHPHRYPDYSLTWAIKDFDLATGQLQRIYVEIDSPDIHTTHYTSMFADGDVALLYADCVRFLAPANYGLALPAISNRYCPAPFVDDFTDHTSGWPIADTGGIIYRYLDGEYNIYHRNANMWGAVTRGDVWNQSKYLEVKGRIVQNQGVWGLLFALNDDWTDFYTFEISPNDQRWFVFHYTSSGGWQMVSQGMSAAIQTGAAFNTLSLSSLFGHGTLGFYINNNLAFHSDWQHKTGRVGLTGASFQNNVDIRYDKYIFVDEHCPMPTQNVSSSSLGTFIALERPDLDSLLPITESVAK
jgi:DNA-binding beta-propeller fold protein YncE